MSYELKIDEKDRVVGRFISSVRKALFMAAFDNENHKKATQQSIATKLGVHRSVINRMLRGGNITLKSAAEIAWALGKAPKFSLEDQTKSLAQKNWVQNTGSINNEIKITPQTRSFGETRSSNVLL
jgi:plasmid maintenance system antidote protein VapI